MPSSGARRGDGGPQQQARIHASACRCPGRRTPSAACGHARVCALAARTYEQAGEPFPKNAGTELPTHQAVIVAFDPRTGEPVALMDGTYITAARTAAGSALSTKLLAREDAEVMALLGTGVQARAHARALPRVREVAEIRLAGRDKSKAERVASELAKELGFVVRAADSYADALDGADIACATTHAVEPVVRREWLSPGTHVTSVGYNPEGREVDDATVADALVIVESRDAALAPMPAGSNDLNQAIRDGVIAAEYVHAEIGELVSGVRPGRTDDEQITLTSRSALLCKTAPPPLGLGGGATGGRGS